MILHTWRPLGLLYFFYYFIFLFFTFYSFRRRLFISAQKMCCRESQGYFFFIFNMLGMYFWWRGMNWQKISTQRNVENKVPFPFVSFVMSLFFSFFFSFKGFHWNSFYSLQAFNCILCSLLFAFSIEISSQILFRSEF